MKSNVRAAVIQDGSVPFNPAATTAKTCQLIADAAAQGVELALFPEAFIGTYPKGLTFDAPVGQRRPEGRDEYLRYADGAITIDGPELRQVCTAARKHGVFVVLGIVERLGSTLYCTVVFVDPKRGLIGQRRKLMPTGAERLIWGFGDGSTLDVMPSELGRIGAVICWENYMPALRMSQYAQQVEIYCAPTADDRDTWLPTMRHIALEGRCYVLSVCQYITRGAFGPEYRGVIGSEADHVLMRGAGVIIDPLGQVLAGPVFDQQAIIVADLERDALVRSKLDFDPVGHYARPDVFSLHVDREAKQAVHF